MLNKMESQDNREGQQHWSVKKEVGIKLCVNFNTLKSVKNWYKIMSNIYYKPFYCCYSSASHTHTHTHTNMCSQLTNYENMHSCSEGNHVR